MDLFGTEAKRLTMYSEDGLAICNFEEECFRYANCKYCPHFQNMRDKLALFENEEESND